MISEFDPILKAQMNARRDERNRAKALVRYITRVKKVRDYELDDIRLIKDMLDSGMSAVEVHKKIST